MTNKKQTIYRISHISLLAGTVVFVLCAFLLIFKLGPLYGCVGDNACLEDLGGIQLVLQIVAWLMPTGFLAVIVSLVVHMLTKPRKGDKNQL